MARKSLADKKIQEITDILFPATKVHETVEEGNKIKYMVDHSVDNNLYAVLIDLREGHNDTACHNTIDRCIDALVKVRTILEASMYLDNDAKYIVAEMPDAETVKNIT